MKAYLLLLTTLLLFVSACDDAVAPPPAGVVELEIGLEPQRLVIDGRGFHLKVEGIALTVTHPSLDGLPAREWHEGTVFLSDNGSGRRRLLARWEGVQPGTLELSIAPRGSSDLPSGAAFQIAGIYNGLVGGPETNYGGFILPFEIAVPLQFDLSGTDLSARGARYRLMLDPGTWFLDPETNRLIAIERLLSTKDRVNDPGALRVVELARAQIRLDRID